MPEICEHFRKVPEFLSNKVLIDFSRFINDLGDAATTLRNDNGGKIGGKFCHKTEYLRLKATVLYAPWFTRSKILFIEFS